MPLNFPDSPTVGQIFTGYTWDGEKWTPPSAAGAVRYDIAQSLTYLQQAQARANIGDLKKNYIVNGAMQISQENGTTAGTTSGYYPVDQFQTAFSNGGAISAAQVALATPGGSTNRFRVTVTTADAAVAATDFSAIVQRIEGFRIVDLKFGSASAKTVTVQFGVKAPAGTYSVVLLNSATNRTYTADYTITAGEANTDVVKSVTIAGDTTGTWLIDSGIGMSVYWSLMAGSTYQQAPGSWGTTNAVGSTNQFNFMGTNGNVFELFDVGLYEGNVAPPFQVPDYATEMALCRRYFTKTVFTWRVSGVAGGIYCMDLPFAHQMRIAPTLTLSGTSRLNVTSPTFVNIDQYQAAFQASATAAGDTYIYNEALVINARM